MSIGHFRLTGMSMSRSASFGAWSETESSNWMPSAASRAKPGTTPQVDRVMCRAPRLGPRPALMSFSARIVSS